MVLSASSFAFFTVAGLPNKRDGWFGGIVYRGVLKPASAPAYIDTDPDAPPIHMGGIYEVCLPESNFLRMGRSELFSAKPRQIPLGDIYCTFVTQSRPGRRLVETFRTLSISEPPDHRFFGDT